MVGFFSVLGSVGMDTRLSTERTEIETPWHRHLKELMSDLTIQKLTKKQKEQIRWLYLGNYSVMDIATKLHIEQDTVRFFVFGADGTGEDKTCLFQIKKGMSSTAITAYIADKINVLDQTAGIALNILNSALVNLQKEVVDGKELNLDDLKKLSGIVVEMDKLVRLESGQATETIQHMGLTTAEAREILAADPFAQPIEAEFKEVETLPWLNEEKK